MNFNWSMNFRSKIYFVAPGEASPRQIPEASQKSRQNPIADLEPFRPYVRARIPDRQVPAEKPRTKIPGKERGGKPETETPNEVVTLETEKQVPAKVLVLILSKTFCAIWDALCE
jgi:hypothetical protein